MNTRSKIATKFYTSERADSSVQIGLAGREVDSERVIGDVNATHRLSSREIGQAPALRAPCAAHISKKHRTFKILGFHESVRKDFETGLITLQQAAVEFYRANWTPYIDIEYTMQQLGIYEEEHQIAQA
ncbi:hypothetical protein ACPV5G_20335 [Photobacterium damselae]|uniref:hypothetical protein n=1 Tax=Photobacterium damselae TaxID=38293 RepID=UPI004068C11B